MNTINRIILSNKELAKNFLGLCFQKIGLIIKCETQPEKTYDMIKYIECKISDIGKNTDMIVEEINKLNKKEKIMILCDDEYKEKLLLFLLCKKLDNITLDEFTKAMSDRLSFDDIDLLTVDEYELCGNSSNQKNNNLEEYYNVYENQYFEEKTKKEIKEKKTRVIKEEKIKEKKTRITKKEKDEISDSSSKEKKIKKEKDEISDSSSKEKKKRMTKKEKEEYDNEGVRKPIKQKIMKLLD
jgi:hypothetical protein